MNSQRMRRTLDRLAYVPLFLDICVAIITGLTILDARLPAFGLDFALLVDQS